LVKTKEPNGSLKIKYLEKREMEKWEKYFSERIIITLLIYLPLFRDLPVVIIRHLIPIIPV